MEYTMKQLYDANVLIDAFNQSKIGVNWKGSIQKYEINLLENTYRTQEALKNGTYHSSPFVEFALSERGKTRWIKSMHIRDRVVQRAICDQILLPLFEKKLIYDNGASMKGKGIDFALERLHKHLQYHYRRFGTEGYIVLIDFTKYFDNIPHDKLLEEFSCEIHDEQLMRFVEYLISLFEIEVGMLPKVMQDEFEFGVFDNLKYNAYLREHPKCLKRSYQSKKLKKSIGVGSQISQIAGVYYPTRIDTYFKNVKGIHGYGRYMDDTYIICRTKEEAIEYLEKMYELCNELKIFVNKKKTQIKRIDQPFTFLKIKHRLLSTGKVIRKVSPDTIARNRRKLKRLADKLYRGELTYEDCRQAYVSFEGRLKKFNNYTALHNFQQLHKELFIDGYLAVANQKGDKQCTIK